MLSTLKKPPRMPSSASRVLVDRVMQNAGQGILFNREHNGKRVTISTITQPVQYYTYAEKDEAELVKAALEKESLPTPLKTTFPALYFNGSEVYEVDATATIAQGDHYVFNVRVDRIHGRI